MKHTPITLEEASSQKRGALYVLNTSHRRTESGGDVFISVAVGQQIRAVRIPKTWVPINLTATLPRKNILESVFFMEAVTNNLVEIISETDARKMMGQPGFREEVARMKARDNAIREASQAKGISKNVTVSGGSDDDESAAESAPKRKSLSVTAIGRDVDEEDDQQVSANFAAFVSSLRELSHVEAVNKIKNRGGELDESEARYLVENLDPVKHSKIIRSVRKQLESA